MKHPHYIAKHQFSHARGEKFKKASRTEPDASMTIPEMLKRNAHGMPLNAKVPLYHGEEDMPDLRTMDISEIHEMVTKTKEQIKKINDDIAERKEKQALHRLKKQLEQQRAAAEDKKAQFEKLKAELYPDDKSDKH